MKQGRIIINENNSNSNIRIHYFCSIRTEFSGIANNYKSSLYQTKRNLSNKLNNNQNGINSGRVTGRTA
jgi:hypothetical protein